MRFLSNVMGDVAAIVCQGSWAPCAQAEKAELQAARSDISTRLDHPSNLANFRLDGWNPHRMRLRQPPNLANPDAQAHTHTCARIRVRVWPFSITPFPVKPRNRLGRLGGWQNQQPCGFQPSNLLAYLFEVGRNSRRVA